MKQPRTQRISRAFGAAAAHYEDHASVQRVVAGTLADLLAQQVLHRPVGERPRILEIGCGTGLLTRRLGALFPNADLTATDLSPTMVATAAAGGDVGARFLTMNGEAPDFDGPWFDLVASSLAFQWFEDLPTALDRLIGLLRPGGSLLFATMAQRSFAEWNAAHRACGLEPGTHAYPAIEELQAMVRRYPDAFLFEEDYVEDFGGARGLLAHLKGIGATVPVEGRTPLSPGQLRQVMRRFDADGGRATYHVAYCRVTRA